MVELLSHVSVSAHLRGVACCVLWSNLADEHSVRGDIDSLAYCLDLMRVTYTESMVLTSGRLCAGRAAPTTNVERNRRWGGYPYGRGANHALAKYRSGCLAGQGVERIRATLTHRISQHRKTKVNGP